MFTFRSAPPSLVVVDDFYEDPQAVRQFALRQDFKQHADYHKGYRTEQRFLFPGLQERFEQALGAKIKDWERYGTNGIFQYCTAKDPLVYHRDSQQYAGAIYLTPDAPIETGTLLLQSRNLPVRTINEETAKSQGISVQELQKRTCGNDRHYYDSTQWNVVDRAGNIYNRLVLWNAQLFHAAGAYFGLSKEDSRLFQLFFFDLEDGAMSRSIPSTAQTFHEQVQAEPPVVVADDEVRALLAMTPEDVVMQLLLVPLPKREPLMKKLAKTNQTFHDEVVAKAKALAG